MGFEIDASVRNNPESHLPWQVGELWDAKKRTFAVIDSVMESITFLYVQVAQFCKL